MLPPGDVAPPWDVALSWHVAWLGRVAPPVDVPMYGHVAWYGAFGTIGGCSDIGARCNVPLRHRPAIPRWGRTPPAGDVALSWDVALPWHVAWCGAFGTVGGHSDVGARCHVPRCNVPLRDNSRCCRRATLHRHGTSHCRGTSRGGGHLAPWAGVPMWGHVATCPYGMIRNVAAGGVALSGPVACGIHTAIVGCRIIGARNA